MNGLPIPVRAALGAAFLLCLAAPGAGALSWDAPAFSLNPKEIAAAASEVKAQEGDDAVFLHEEDSYCFQASGAALHAYRVMYKLLSKEGLTRWSTASCYWQPWRQERPVIRARVISGDGNVSILDQDTIADGTVRQDDPDLYSDSRVLNAPLPNLADGCVVEFEIVTTDLAPLLGAGGAFRIWLGHSAPVLSRRLFLDSPASMPLRWTVRGSESIKTSREESGGRLKVIFDAANLAAVREVERYLTSDVVPSPCIDFSTGSSWKEISRAYADLAEGVVGKDPLSDYASRAAAGKGADERAVLISNILYRIQKDVRYTGINFGENAILPHPPLDTLARGYGDCKDQASLLVAALRARGIAARLALLMAGDAPDVQPGLPGFGLFNHAIVYLPKDNIWIDPTANFYRPGSLPPMDQGRRALVISADTESLAVTPEASPSDTLFREVREFRLSEFGPATVNETTEMSGSFEASYRADFEQSDVKSTRERLEKYVKNVYEAKSLAGFTESDPRAMDTPFTIRLSAAEAKRGMTDDNSSVVVIQSGSLVDFLPGFLTREDKTETKPRVNDVRLWQPFVSEYEYRIYPPPGFRAAALPEDQTVGFGPAFYTKTFRLKEDGSVTVLVRFDCVKRVYPPKEAAVLKDEVRKFLEGKAIIVTFEQIGESLLASGKYREALEEFRALAAAHPAEALHRMQISRALMAAGFGRDALAEGKKAAELEPKLARARAHLAWALLHDDFGRIFEKGADLPSARAEYARAAELDPADAKYTANLAILFEYNDAMVRYGQGAELEEAVSLYRKVAKDIKGTDSWNGFALDLLYLGRFREMKEELADFATDRTRQALFVAACAALDGPAAAQREATRLAGAAEERRNVLGLAAQFLLVAHRYPESAELLISGARGSPNLTQTLSLAEKLKVLKPLTPAAMDESTPTGLILALLRAAFNPGGEEKDLGRYFAANVRVGGSDPLWRRRTSQAFAAARSELYRLQLPAGIFLDFFGALLHVDTLQEGEATSVLVSFPEMPARFQPTVFYVKREEGVLRVVDAGSGFRGIAREMLASLKAGRPEEARSWIRLLRVQHARKAAFPDVSGEPLFALLPKSGEPTTEEMSLAAAFELARSDLREDAELGLPILLARWRAEKDGGRALQIARPLAEALMLLSRNEELLEVTGSMVEAAHDDRRAIELRGIALDRDGKPDRGDELVRAKIGGDPSNPDPGLLRLLAVRLAGAGRYQEAMAIVGQLIDSGKAEEMDYNDLGWFSLYLGVPEPDVVAGRQLVQRLMEGTDAELHTLACILGDSGRMLEAQEVFGKYLSRRGGNDPDGSVWLAYGIMAERFGLSETAIDAFKKVVREPDFPYQGVSSFALAQKHLRQLKK